MKTVAGFSALQELCRAVSRGRHGDDSGLGNAF